MINYIWLSKLSSRNLFQADMFFFAIIDNYMSIFYQSFRNMIQKYILHLTQIMHQFLSVLLSPYFGGKFKSVKFWIFANFQEVLTSFACFLSLKSRCVFSSKTDFESLKIGFWGLYRTQRSNSKSVHLMLFDMIFFSSFFLHMGLK